MKFGPSVSQKLIISTDVRIKNIFYFQAEISGKLLILLLNNETARAAADVGR
jgi:hypothetical protein